MSFFLGESFWSPIQKKVKTKLICNSTCTRNKHIYRNISAIHLKKAMHIYRNTFSKIIKPECLQGVLDKTSLCTSIHNISLANQLSITNLYCRGFNTL